MLMMRDGRHRWKEGTFHNLWTSLRKRLLGSCLSVLQVSTAPCGLLMGLVWEWSDQISYLFWLWSRLLRTSVWFLLVNWVEWVEWIKKKAWKGEKLRQIRPDGRYEHVPSRGIDEHNVAIVESAWLDDNLPWCSVWFWSDHSPSL